MFIKIIPFMKLIHVNYISIKYYIDKAILLKIYDTTISHICKSVHT